VRAATVAMPRPGTYASTTIDGLRFLRGPFQGFTLKLTGATVHFIVQLAGYSPDSNDESAGSLRIFTVRSSC
jgi:hypothetical protein